MNLNYLYVNYIVVNNNICYRMHIKAIISMKKLLLWFSSILYKFAGQP